jgi:hypothetical protein
MSENTKKNRGLGYNIDIVFCLDLSSTSAAELGNIKDFVLHFPTDLIHRHENVGKQLGNTRVRFILFPSVYSKLSHKFSHFQSLSSEKGSRRFQAFVQNLHVTDQQTDTKKSLRALSDALHSNWTQRGDRQRHIVVMATGLGHHDKFEGLRSSDQKNFPEIDSLIDELTNHWDGSATNYRPRKAKLGRGARRLVLFAPDTHPWQILGDTWAQALWLPTSTMSEITREEFQTFAEVLSNGV